MKKIMNVLLVCCLVTMAACAQSSKKQETKTMKKTLVAYFSATGTTAEVATRLASVAEADLYEIKPEKKYSAADLDWTDKKARSTVEMQDKKSRPAMVKDLQDAARYDTVYVGFPIWWYTAPTIINTFLEAYPFEGNTVILFATSGGSTPDKALQELRARYPKIHFAGAQLLNGADEGELKAFVGKFQKK